MGQFTTGNKGRPIGAKGKLPSRENLIKLLEYCKDDLIANRDKLTNKDKIALLNAFRNLYLNAEENGSVQIYTQLDWSKLFKDESEQG